MSSWAVSLPPHLSTSQMCLLQILKEKQQKPAACTYYNLTGGRVQELGELNKSGAVNAYEVVSC